MYPVCQRGVGGWSSGHGAVSLAQVSVSLLPGPLVTAHLLLIVDKMLYPRLHSGLGDGSESK